MKSGFFNEPQKFILCYFTTEKKRTFIGLIIPKLRNRLSPKARCCRLKVDDNFSASTGLKVLRISLENFFISFSMELNLSFGLNLSDLSYFTYLVIYSEKVKYKTVLIQTV